MKTPLYVKFNDPEDPEKPVRFTFHQNYFDDTYRLFDKETETEIIMTTQYLMEKERKPFETDTQFVIRVVKEGLEKGEMVMNKVTKLLTSGEE